MGTPWKMNVRVCVFALHTIGTVIDINCTYVISQILFYNMGFIRNDFNNHCSLRLKLSLQEKFLQNIRVYSDTQIFVVC